MKNSGNLQEFPTDSLMERIILCIQLLYSWKTVYMALLLNNMTLEVGAVRLPPFFLPVMSIFVPL